MTDKPGLAAALAAFQAELPRVAKGAAVDAGTYTYTYAELDEVSAAVLPMIAKHGLSFSAKPTLNQAGRFVLAYTLRHASGERDDGEWPLPDKGSPQQLGGHITYARRYCLLAVTGVAPGGEDDDGKEASQMKTAWSDPEHMRLTQPPPEERVNGRRSQRVRPGQDDPVGETWDEPENEPGGASKGQVTGIQMAYQKLGFTRAERDQCIEASEQIIGRPLTGPNEGSTHNNLSYNEARKLRDTLEGFKGDRGDLLAMLVEAATP